MFALKEEHLRRLWDFRFEGNFAVTPDGTRFAHKYRKGVYNSGKTPISAFVRLNRDRFADLPASLLRVMEAVSGNEGKLEAISTYDDSFLTFGAFQWPVGAGDAADELPALLGRLKQDHAQIFDQFFGR